MAIRRAAALLLTLAATAYANVALSEFFPYGPAAGDSRVPTADDNFINITINPGNVFHFFRNSYTEMFLNNNGGVSFLRGAPQFTPTCGPLDTPMIMPYWADVNTVLGGNVYYRQTTDSLMIQKARDECARAFPGLNTQNINWMFLATWDDVPFFGAQPSTGTCGGLNKRNNFQLALVTDGNLSFAMFFYNNITWTTGTASGGDCNGLNGTPAKAGFDVGDGVNFFTLPGTCTAGILDVTGTSNVEQQGKWIFRIDDTFVDPGVPQEETSSFSPIEETTSERPAPIAAGSECDPNMCELVGHCTSYFTCDVTSRRRVAWECSEGLFWNPKKPKTPVGMASTTWAPPASTSGYAPTWGSASTSSPAYSWNGTNYATVGSPVPGRQLLPFTSTFAPAAPEEEECHGSCDVWENLPEDVKATYESDETCFPKCYYASLGECASTYLFHKHNLERRQVEVLECPVDTRHGMNVPLVWVQERESCDFCYNAMRSTPLATTTSNPAAAYPTTTGYYAPAAPAAAYPSTTTGYYAPATAYPSTTTGYYAPAGSPTAYPGTTTGYYAPAAYGRSMGSSRQWGQTSSSAPYYNWNITAPAYPQYDSQMTCCPKYDYDLIPEPIMIAVPTIGRSLKGGKTFMAAEKGHNFDLKHKK